jgi:hypothetical protein
VNPSPPPRPRLSNRTALLLAILLGALFLGFWASLSNPHLNLPVVSQVACSVKGDTWYGGGILGAPGCYSPQP